MYILLAVLLLGGSIVTESVDLTVTEKAKGADVVNAVVDLIDQSCVFANNRLLLRRIAYAETQDGAASFTFTHNSADFYGGIWQVDEASFTATQTSVSVDVEAGIKTEFDIDWKSVQYTELWKPLYSGIAAMLKISSYYEITDIPQSIDAQAIYWSTHYTENTWTDATTVYVSASATVTTSCNSPKADIVFVVDGSGSIGQTNFDSVKVFIEDTVNSLDISQQTVRVGLIEFSGKAETQFDLQAYNTKDDVKTAVAAMPYITGSTNSAAGLNASKNMILQQGRQVDGVPVVNIFLTDGKSNDEKQTEIAADNLHNTLPEVTVFAIGVGSGPDVTELTTIASAPKCIHVYSLSAFSDITSFTSQILNGACKAPARLWQGREIKVKVKKGQFYYFKIRAKKTKNGVRVELKSSLGAVKTFFSWRVQNPSEALHDSFIEVNTQKSSESVHISWDAEAEKNAEEAISAVGMVGGTASASAGGSGSASVSGQVEYEATLYGGVVGVDDGDNEFSMKYTDSAFRQAGGLLSLLVALLLLSRNYL